MDETKRKYLPNLPEFKPLPERDEDFYNQILAIGKLCGQGDNQNLAGNYIEEIMKRYGADVEASMAFFIGYNSQIDKKSLLESTQSHRRLSRDINCSSQSVTVFPSMEELCKKLGTKLTFSNSPTHVIMGLSGEELERKNQERELQLHNYFQSLRKTGTDLPENISIPSKFANKEELFQAIRAMQPSNVETVEKGKTR